MLPFYRLCLILLDVLRPLHAVMLTVEEQIERCPPVSDFRPFFSKIPDLGRRLHVACPCIGIHACGWAVDAMQVPTNTNNAWDLEYAYHKALLQQLTDAGMIICDINLHLGAIAGNLLHHQLKDLELPVDFLISGPPCPPWAGQGCKRNFPV